MLNNSKLHDTVRVEAAHQLGQNFWREDIEKSIQYGNLALKLSEKAKHEYLIAQSYNFLAGTYFFKGDYSLCLDYNLKCLTQKQKVNEKGKTVASKKSIAATYNNIGGLFLNMANYDKALEYHMEALKIKEELQDSLSLAKSLNNIGNVYEQSGNFKKAMEFQLKAIEYLSRLDDKYYYAASLNNLGNIYLKEKKYDQALLYLNQSLKLREEIKDEEGVGSTLNNIGNCYYLLEDLQNALSHYLRAELILIKYDDVYNLTAIYCNLAEIYRSTKNYGRSKMYLDKAVNMVANHKLMDLEKKTYRIYSELLFDLGNFEEAYKYQEKYIAVNDSIFKEDSQKRIAEMQVKYENEIKEKEIESLKKENEVTELKSLKQEAEIQKQRMYSISLIVGLLLVTAAAFLAYNRFKVIKKLHGKLEIQNLQIAEKNKSITDSINYAKRIQDALLQHREHVSKHLPEHFIIYMPRDIVSGDFYWALERGEYLYLCVADSTGHGVPGAFMSLLGISFLNELTKGSDLFTPAEILEVLREKIITQLGQSGESDSTKDGMDMAMVRLNLKTKELQYAGANNSIYIYKNNSLDEVRADKQPVGYSNEATNFTNNVIQLQSGDAFYLFSDGFADQFGGLKGKKMKYSKFKEILSHIQQTPLNEQKILIEKAFMDWKGDLEQVDDICILGMKV